MRACPQKVLGFIEDVILKVGKNPKFPKNDLDNCQWLPNTFSMAIFGIPIVSTTTFS